MNNSEVAGQRNIRYAGMQKDKWRIIRNRAMAAMVIGRQTQPDRTFHICNLGAMAKDGFPRGVWTHRPSPTANHDLQTSEFIMVIWYGRWGGGDDSCLLSTCESQLSLLPREDSGHASCVFMLSLLSLYSPSRLKGKSR